MEMAGAICRRVPRRAAEVLGEASIEWYLRSHPDVLSVVEANLRGAFPDAELRQISRWAWETPMNYMRGIVDYLYAEEQPPKILPPLERYEEQLADIGAKIIVTAHMGNWEVGGLFLGRTLGPHWILAFPELDPGMERLRADKRARAGMHTILRGGGLSGLMEVRSILKKGGTVIVLLERPIGKDSQSVRLRGRRTRFLRSPALLSASTGVPIIPVAVMALGNGLYQGHAGEPIHADAESPGEAIQAAADFFGGILEQYPDQWYNFYPYWEERP